MFPDSQMTTSHLFVFVVSGKFAFIGIYFVCLLLFLVVRPPIWPKHGPVEDSLVLVDSACSTVVKVSLALGDTLLYGNADGLS